VALPILLGVILLGAGLILFISYVIRGRGQVTPMAGIGIAAGPIEMELGAQRLQTAGVQAWVQGIHAPVGDPSGRLLDNDYSIETLGARERQGGARALLGLLE
jgi:hypothetical protein